MLSRASLETQFGEDPQGARPASETPRFEGSLPAQEIRGMGTMSSTAAMATTLKLGLLPRDCGPTSNGLHQGNRNCCELDSPSARARARAPKSRVSVGGWQLSGLAPGKVLRSSAAHVDPARERAKPPRRGKTRSLEERSLYDRHRRTGRRYRSNLPTGAPTSVSGCPCPCCAVRLRPTTSWSFGRLRHGGGRGRTQ